MPIDDFKFPEDSGTGLTDTVDWDDAGGFAFLGYHPNISDYVLEGFELDVTWSTATLNITEGVGIASAETSETNDHTDKGGEPAKVVHGAAFKFQRGPAGDIPLTAGQVNHVYLGLDLTTNNRVIPVVNTDETPPSEPYLKLGTVNMGGTNSPADIHLDNRVPTQHVGHVLHGP